MSASLTYTITADTADAQRQLAELVRAFQSVKKEGDLGSVGRGAAAGISGVDKLKGSVGGLLAALGSVAAAAAGVGFALKRGLDANSAAENTELGIKTLIASLYDVRDANGELVTGAKALEIAGGEAEKQLQALRVAGMNTAASAKELGDAFKVALGTGAGAGLSVTEIRQLTVDLVQAAGVFNVMGDQLNSEIRAVLSGDQVDNSAIAAGLQISAAQIKLWREQGTLVENLNERLAMFRVAGAEAGKTWTATLSNLGDGFDMFLRQTTGGAFDGIKTALSGAITAAIDPNSGNITPAFDGLAKLATQVFTDIGGLIADMIDDAVDLAQRFSGWLERNRDTVDSTYSAFKNVGSAVGDVINSMARLLGQTALVSAEAGFLRTAFNTAALTVALISDTLSAVIGVVAKTGGAVVTLLVEPLRFVAGVIDKVANTNLTAIADKVIAMASGSMKFGEEMARSALALEATNRTAKRIAADGVASIVKPLPVAPPAASTAPGGTIDNKKNGDKAKADAAAKAAADKAAREAKRSADKAAREAEAQARKDAAALDALNKSLADYSRAQAAALREQALAELDADLQKQLVSQQDYLQRKADIERAALDEETRIANARIDELQKVADDEKLAKDERLKAAAEIVKVRGELLQLDGKKAVIGIRLDAESDAVRKYLKELGADLQAQLQELAGDSAGAARSRLAAETAKMLEDPRVKGSSEVQALIERVREAKAAIIELDEATRLVSVVNDELSAKERAITRDRERQAIDEVEAQDRIRQARLEAAAAMLPQIEAAEKLAATTGDPARIEEVKQLREAYVELAGTMDALAVGINETFFGSIRQGFKDLVSGAKSFGDVLRTVITDVLSKLADLYLDRALTGLLGNLGGAGGGLGGALANIFRGRAVGGAVHAGGAYIVGERGPEPFFPGAPGTIVPTARLQSALADMLGISARRAPTPAFSPVAGPVMGGGSTNVSVSPKVVIAAGDVLNALRNEPGFGQYIVQVAASNGKRIQAGW